MLQSCHGPTSLPFRTSGLELGPQSTQAGGRGGFAVSQFRDCRGMLCNSPLLGAPGLFPLSDLLASGTRQD